MEAYPLLSVIALEELRVYLMGGLEGRKKSLNNSVLKKIVQKHLLRRTKCFHVNFGIFIMKFCMIHTVHHQNPFSQCATRTYLSGLPALERMIPSRWINIATKGNILCGDDGRNGTTLKEDKCCVLSRSEFMWQTVPATSGWMADVPHNCGCLFLTARTKWAEWVGVAGNWYAPNSWSNAYFTGKIVGKIELWEERAAENENSH